MQHSQEIFESIQAIEFASESLYSSTSFKGLLRNFGQQISILADASVFSVLTFNESNKPKSLKSLKSLDLKIDHMDAISSATHAHLEGFLLKEFPDTHNSKSDSKNGFITISLDNNEFSLCSIANPNSDADTTFLIWNSKPLSTSQESLINILVKQVQREAAWYNKLNSTQSLLYKDDLTGLFNNRYFEISIENELRRSGRFETPFSLLVIDLDDFKPINDTHGHLSGSSVLAQVAVEIKEAIREIDIPIRYGGDEFVVLLLGTNTHKAKMVAERIRMRIESKNFKMEDGSIDKVTASIGIASYPEHGRTREDLFNIADKMMYTCKKQGKNRVSIVKKNNLHALSQNKDNKAVKDQK